jgi:hypothetical protein
VIQLVHFHSDNHFLPFDGIDLDPGQHIDHIGHHHHHAHPLDHIVPCPDVHSDPGPLIVYAHALVVHVAHRDRNPYNRV